MTGRRKDSAADTRWRAAMSHLTPLLALLLLAADDRPEPPPEGARVRLGTSRFRNGSAILSVAPSPDGRRIATAGGDRVVRLWDARTGRVVASCDDSRGPVHHVCFAP